MPVTPARPGSTRPLLKLSGEMLGGSAGEGFDRLALESFSQEIAELVAHGIIPGIVIGGGNLFRGGRSHLPALQRHHADTIGMLATVMNAICFADHLSALGVPSRVFSAIPIGTQVSTYDIDAARHLLDQGTVCFFAGGTGHPYFSTDTAAALRAVEVGCDLLIKATKVDGVYSADPSRDPTARRFDRISYQEVFDRRLGVMDLMAIALCRDHKLPLVVLSLTPNGNVFRACQGDPIGTTVYEGE